MTTKTLALGILALLCAGCGSTPYRAPQTQPPPLWSGESGLRPVRESVRVATGTQSVGAVLIEHDVTLARTGTIKNSIRVRNESGDEIIIPAGTQAYAINASLYRQGRPLYKIDPIEWCVVLPQIVCIAWESPTSAYYEKDARPGGFAFLPTLSFLGGMRGPVPDIEEGPVDFGVRLKNQMHLSELTDAKLTLESRYSDGTHVRRARTEAHGWDASLPGSRQQVLVKSPVYVVALGHVAGSNTVEVRRIGDPNPNAKELTVLLNLLIGVDGTVRDGRIAISSGSAELDAKALEEAKKSWKLTPAVINGQPAEKWGEFAITFKFVD